MLRNLCFLSRAVHERAKLPQAYMRNRRTDEVQRERILQARTTRTIAKVRHRRAQSNAGQERNRQQTKKRLHEAVDPRSTSTQASKRRQAIHLADAYSQLQPGGGVLGKITRALFLVNSYAIETTALFFNCIQDFNNNKFRGPVCCRTLGAAS